MTGDLYLDIDAFSGLIHTLDTAAEDMTSANKKLADADAGNLGSSGLDKAADNFRSRWKYGIEQIAESTSKMVEGLELTHKLYAEQERINAGALDTIGGAPPSAPAPDPGSSPAPTPGASLDL